MIHETFFCNDTQATPALSNLKAALEITKID